MWKHVSAVPDEYDISAGLHRMWWRPALMLRGEVALGVGAALHRQHRCQWR